MERFSMDFFSAQDTARRNTLLLVALFVLAVLGLMVVTNLVVMLTLGLLSPTSLLHSSTVGGHWQTFAGVSAAVGLVILAGTFYKMHALSAGGDAVAMMLGGEPVFADHEDFFYRRFVNVVEEMSLAAGIPMPQPYILAEGGINAFAAGLTRSDAVVVVTRGALQQLNREQLQGVVAHEFSHILNGDMRLNVRLVGILHGILLIGLIGRSMSWSGERSSRRGNGLVFLGFACMVIGYAGSFFGNMIKAAVSRQREFLADAAAVQFTRNPEGIGTALIRIGASQKGSLILHARGEELSHFFFGQATRARLISPFATHPPLTKRIRRILPTWDGGFPQKETASVNVGQGAAESAGVSALAGKGDGRQAVTMPGAVDVELGQTLFAEIPEIVRKAARDPFAARALIVYLLLDKDPAARTRQLELLAKIDDRGVKGETLRLLRDGIALPVRLRLPVLELALPTLRRLSLRQKKRFLETVAALIVEDGRISLFEWCVQIIVREYLRSHIGREDGRRPEKERATRRDVLLLLSMLCYIAGSGSSSKAAMFARALQELHIPAAEMLPLKELSFQGLDHAMQRLRHLPLRKKGILFGCCVTIVTTDGKVIPAEAEVIRALSAALDVPAPPGMSS
ncbi:MAG: M48 family metallopeptidase [Desulfopila sp.]